MKIIDLLVNSERNRKNQLYIQLDIKTFQKLPSDCVIIKDLIKEVLNCKEVYKFYFQIHLITAPHSLPTVNNIICKYHSCRI